MYESNTNTNTENKKAFQKWLAQCPENAFVDYQKQFREDPKNLKLLFLLSKNNARIFTLQELKELQSSFKYGSYASCGDPDQPIVRKSILRKIEKAIEFKIGLMKHLNKSI